MKEFYEDLYDLPEQNALKTKGGFFIGFSREELSSYFGLLLEKKSLEQMVGETVYWVLIPSIVSIYSYPIILFITGNLGYTLLASLGLLMSMSLFNQSSYNYSINRYLVRPLSNIVPKALFNILGSFLLFRTGHSTFISISPLIWWLLNDRIPLVYLVIELLMIKIKSRMYKLSDPDGVLRQVGIYWAKRYDFTITEDGQIIKK